MTTTTTMYFVIYYIRINSAKRIVCIGHNTSIYLQFTRQHFSKQNWSMQTSNIRVFVDEQTSQKQRGMVAIRSQGFCYIHANQSISMFWVVSIERRSICSNRCGAIVASPKLVFAVVANQMYNPISLIIFSDIYLLSPNSFSQSVLVNACIELASKQEMAAAKKAQPIDTFGTGID